MKVILPRILMELLPQVGDREASHLAIAFVRHAIEEYGGGEVPLSFTSVLTAAQNYISGRAALDGLLDAREEFYAARVGAQGTVDIIASAVHMAVNLSCGRAMEESGAVLPGHARSSLVSVAKAAQTVAARAAAQHRRSGPWMKWEEARWQLMALVEVVPNPNLSTE